VPKYNVDDLSNINRVFICIFNTNHQHVDFSHVFGVTYWHNDCEYDSVID
jgi:hypothetical protein